MVRSERAASYDVVVVGAGQAGLAIGYYLARRGHNFLILERADDVASAWRERWDSLTLFTPRGYNSLPGLDFPGESDGYPGRDEVVDYLRSYAARFDLPSSLEDGVVQMHSTGYRKPADLPPGRALIVGGGNTGYQIAEELAGTHEVHLAVGTRQMPLPQRLLGRDAFWWLTKTGLIEKSVETRLGRKASAKETLVGSTPRKAKRRGVVFHGRASAAAGRTVRFADGDSLEVDGVIWATGFRSDYGWIDLPITDANGRLVHRRGVTDVAGLFMLGMQWQWTRGSALLGFVKDDAAFIAERIAEHTPSRAMAEAPELTSAAGGD